MAPSCLLQACWYLAEPISARPGQRDRHANEPASATPALMPALGDPDKKRLFLFLLFFPSCLSPTTPVGVASGPASPRIAPACLPRAWLTLHNPAPRPRVRDHVPPTSLPRLPQPLCRPWVTSTKKRFSLFLLFFPSCLSPTTHRRGRRGPASPRPAPACLLQACWYLAEPISARPGQRDRHANEPASATPALMPALGDLDKKRFFFLFSLPGILRSPHRRR